MSCITAGYHGYAVQFSPYPDKRLACVAAQNFGISGRGALYVIDTEADVPRVGSTYAWSDGLYDVTWSEREANILVTASGDGSIQAWNTALPSANPVSIWHGHKKEVYSVHWSQVRTEQMVVSGSWDMTLRLWDPDRGQTLSILTGHDHIVYSGVWSPRIPGCIASTSGDQTLRVWDIKRPHMACIVIPAHDAEVLCCDWCKYDSSVVATGAVDGVVRVWDLRNPRRWLAQLPGHENAVRRVKFSPHEAKRLASCSYDFSIRLWDYGLSSSALHTVSHHSEFVYGLDFDLHTPGRQTVHGTKRSRFSMHHRHYSNRLHM
ncbi:PREDICTED: peroxisomal targeting signal 2 receptor-like isoform X2 [Priapulus caudatus]|uniref:Peroxin-7 n=1 Tax=Priapulus caudatus TaxID=37621 RepID=A0ABM1EZR3_PRICU|nr:PREDICTED: peroxisomal targeting signal 2 receptor-like isoform X2 [Priapulus caudatus]